MSPKGSKKDQTGIRLRPEQTAALRRILASSGDKEATLSSLIRRAVDEYIQRHETVLADVKPESKPERQLTDAELRALEARITTVHTIKPED